MFKKNLLCIAFAMAMSQGVITNAQNIDISSLPVESIKEINKYQDIIQRLKSQLDDKVSYNKALEQKLVEATNLSKNTNSENVTPEQLGNLNVLVLKLKETIKENDNNNEVMKNKILVLEKFLNTYSQNQLRKQEAQLSLKPTEPVIYNNPVRVVPTVIKDPVKVEPVIKTEDSKVNEAEKELNEYLKKEEESQSESDKQKIKSQIANPVIEEKTVQKIDAQKIIPIQNELVKPKVEEKPKVIHKDRVEMNEPIVIGEDKGFVENIKERIENIISWFKSLFGNEENVETDKQVVNTVKVMEEDKKPIETIVSDNNSSINKDEVINKEITENKINSDIKELKIQEKSTVIDTNPKIEVQKPIEDHNQVLLNQGDITKGVENRGSSKDVQTEPLLQKDSVPSIQPIPDEIKKESEESKTPNSDNSKSIEDDLKQEAQKINEPSNVGDKTDSVNKVEANEKAMLDFIDNNETIIIKTQKPSKDIKDTAAIKDLSKGVVLEKDKDKTPDLSVPLEKHQLYQVKKGDNLTKIVKSNFKLSNQLELNSKIKEIANLNGIKAVDIIHTGDIIKLS